MQLNSLITAGTAMAALAWASQAAAAPEPSRPNIVFFLADDQRNDTLGCAGHPIVRTPAIDRLAEQGVRFANMFVVNSICMASRASIMTSTTQRTHGVYSGSTPMAPGLMPAAYAHLLRQAGYSTGFVGKVHFTIDGCEAPYGWFDYYKPVDRNPYFHPMPDGSLRHETDLNADYAIEYLNQQSAGRPFCLSVSFNAAHAEDGDLRPGIGHFPWPPSTDGLYEDIGIQPPRLGDPAIYAAHPDFLKQSLNRERFFWRWDTPEKYQVNMRAYFRMLTGIDNAVGRVVKELERLGLAGNTIIVYSADNGYYMGDRGFTGKWTHYEQSLRVPLIVYDPRPGHTRRGIVDTHLVLNTDLAPTFLAWAGLEPPESYQGKALQPLLAGEAAPWRGDFFCEHLGFQNWIPPWEGVRTSRYKYARYFTQEPAYEFLHDLEADPDELVNLAQDPACRAIVETLRVQTDNHIRKYSRALR